MEQVTNHHTVINKNSISPFSRKNKLARLLWNIVYTLFFRITPYWALNKYRNYLLTLFGAKIGKGSIIYPNVKIFAPWNLQVGEYTCIGPHTDVYNMDKIIIGNNVTISQYAVLCTGSHDISSSSMNLITKPIIIKDQVWVCAYAKVMPGLTLEEGSVLALDSVLTHSTEQWKVYAGHPAQSIKNRVLKYE